MEIETLFMGFMLRIFGTMYVKQHVGWKECQQGKCSGMQTSLYVLGNKQKFPMSLKDLCSIHLIRKYWKQEYIPEIEGRMKSKEYTYVTTSIYRKYLDLYWKKGRQGFRVEEEDMKSL